MLFDKFTHYVIKDEELDSTIYSIQESILAYQQFIVKEMKRISDAKGSELITYLRDEENLSWNEIKDIVHYSLRQCHRLYNCKKIKMAHNGTFDYAIIVLWNHPRTIYL